MLDAHVRLLIDSKLARTAREVPVLVAASSDVPAGRVAALEVLALGCEVVTLPGPKGRVDVGALLDELGRRGMTNVLVEGGGRVLGSFFDAGEVDEVDVFIAPIIEGGSHEFTPARGLGVEAIDQALRLESPVISQVDGDVRIQGRIARRS